MFLASDTYDPLLAAIAPPPAETLEQKLQREERDARALEKPIRILVLGQAMSGKTTTIKNFQMAYAHKSWAEERSSWHVVVLFNLVRNVNLVVDVLIEETEKSVIEGRRSALTEWHRSLLFRLSPLRRVEKDLKIFLGSSSHEEEDSSNSSKKRPTTSAGLSDSSSIYDYRDYTLTKKGSNEFCIWSSSGWKSILDQVRTRSLAPGKEAQLPRVARSILKDCKDDVNALWTDTTVQHLLRAKYYGRIEDTPGFFLNDVDRILARDYKPTDQDIVRTRLRTTGLQEYRFTLDEGMQQRVSLGRDWIMYDVAGPPYVKHVSLPSVLEDKLLEKKAAWIPFFPDITSLIFLAPVSSFDEKLPENPRINALEDTYALWKTVCSSKLLADVQLILFLNKTDILARKLEQGIRVKDHLRDFGGKSNDFPTVSEWIRRNFKRIFQDNNPTPNRNFTFYFTSVIDTKSTHNTLEAVQSAILRNDILKAGLI